jgi:hypothetical protein
MRKAISELANVERELRTILESCPKELFTLAQLEAKLKQVAPDDVREALWNLHYQGHAETVQPTAGVPEQYWKAAQPQRDQVKNRQAKWQVTASGSVFDDSSDSLGQ